MVIVTVCSKTAAGQTVDEIIQKYLAATGGAENWKKIKSIKQNCIRTSRGVEIPVTVTVVQGKGLRTESTVNGMTSYYVVTDKAGWSYSPSRMQKPDALTDDAVKQAQNSLDIQGPLIDYKEKGNKVVNLGTDDVEGTECYKLKVILPSGKEETIFIDASNYYLVRTVDKVKANGKEQVYTSTYGDYQQLPEGIIYPMSVNGLNIKSIEINKPVDEHVFEMPQQDNKK